MLLKLLYQCFSQVYSLHDPKFVWASCKLWRKNRRFILVRKTWFRWNIESIYIFSLMFSEMSLKTWEPGAIWNLLKWYNVSSKKLVFSAKEEKRAELKKEMRLRRASQIESRSHKVHVYLWFSLQKFSLFSCHVIQ